MVGAFGVFVLAAVAARKWQLRWGADPREVTAELAGDDLVTEPDLVATRASTISAPASQVWPWLARLGQARGGFYSYDAWETWWAARSTAPTASSRNGSTSRWATR
jgi:hypothetical protein